MYSGLKYALAFVGGAAVGGIVAWKLLEAKFKKIADEEIESVKETYSKNKDSATDEDDDSEYIVYEGDIKQSPEVREYRSLVDKYTEKGGSDSMEDSEPHVIAPELFGEDDYERISLSYWADGVLTDEMDQVVEDVEGTVGWVSLTRFGEYEDDAVHVRNDRLRCNYEILMDTREYYETVGKNLNPSGKE